MTSEEILALESARYAAQLARDGQWFVDNAEPTMLYGHSNGAVEDRDSLVETINTGRIAYRSVTRHSEDVAVYDGCALISARVTLEITVGGSLDKTIDGRALVAWVRGADGRWRFAAWQSTPMPA